MKVLASILVAYGSLAAAATIPRTFLVPNGMCCFNLQDTSSRTSVQQDSRSGYLSFGAGQPTGLYCLDPNDSRNVLWDSSFNACIIDFANHFQCLDPTPGDDVWSLRRDGSNLMLEHNGDNKFTACRVQSAGELVFGLQPPKDAQCRSNLQFVATGLQGSCSSF